MVHDPTAPLGTISSEFSLSTLPWTVQSTAFHLPMDALEKKYKEVIFEPWWKYLKEEGEKSLLGTIQVSSSVARAVVEAALEAEDKRYTPEEEQKLSTARATISPYIVALNFNLWAAESALILIRKMLKESLPTRGAPLNRI
jgi:hypothetical protein